MSSIHLATYADLARDNNCVYFGEKERDSEEERKREGLGGMEADLSIKGDHILATEPLSRD